jgi:hypothetical protein
MGEGIDEYAKLRSHLVSPLILEMAAAVLELGALFGAITCGVLTDKYCRRHSIFFASSGSFVNPRKRPNHMSCQSFSALVQGCNAGRSR